MNTYDINTGKKNYIWAGFPLDNQNFDFVGFKTVELNNIYFADYNSWFDPLYNSFTRSIVSFYDNFVNAEIILNSVKLHTSHIAITFEFYGI